MRKIFITIGKLDRGGAEMRTLRLINDLNRIQAKAKYYIYVVSGEVGELTPEFLTQSNLEIIYGKKGLLGLNLFFKTLKNIAPEVLHINASLAGGIYAVVGRLAGIENIFCHIRTTEHYGSGLIYHLKQNFFSILLNNFSTKVIGVCQGARKLSKTSQSKWLTIYNGIDIDDRESLENERLPYSLVCLGRMHEAKNQIFLVDVISELCLLRPEINWQLDFYGKENTIIKENIMLRTHKLGVSQHIKFCGQTQQPLEVLKKYNFLVLPSVREGLPGVVLEALSVGCESIVSGLDGCKEISEQNAYVHVVDGYDSREWAKMIITQMEKMHTYSRQEVRDTLKNSSFTNEQHVSSMVKLWDI